MTTDGDLEATAERTRQRPWQVASAPGPGDPLDAEGTPTSDATGSDAVDHRPAARDPRRAIGVGAQLRDAR